MTRTSRLRWAAAATLAAATAATAAIAPAAGARAPRSCKAPHARFHSGAVRIYTAVGPAGDQAWYVCSARLRRPRLFTDEGAGSRDSRAHFRRQGRRVGYFWRWDTVQASGWVVGWVDVNTAFSPSFLTSFENRPGSLGIDGIALNTRGAVAFVERLGGRQQRIGWIPRSGPGIGNPRDLTDPMPAVINPRTLRFHGNAVSWRTSGDARGVVHTSAADNPIGD